MCILLCPSVIAGFIGKYKKRQNTLRQVIPSVRYMHNAGLPERPGHKKETVTGKVHSTKLYYIIQ